MRKFARRPVDAHRRAGQTSGCVTQGVAGCGGRRAGLRTGGVDHGRAGAQVRGLFRSGTGSGRETAAHGRLRAGGGPAIRGDVVAVVRVTPKAERTASGNTGAGGAGTRSEPYRSSESRSRGREVATPKRG